VAAREAEQTHRLLVDTGVVKPANIGFKQPELLHWRTDGGHRQGTLRNIKAFYDSLDIGRLVVLGEAGSGKTMLVGGLLLDLVAAMPDDDPLPGSHLTVPVRLSLPAFKSGDSEPAKVSADLDAWIVRILTDVHGLAARIAGALVKQGWILPILDGLDEMDPTGDEPVRAAAVIRALNYPVGKAPRRVVITCRTDLYRQRLVNLTERSYLQDATAVEIQRLTSGHVGDYLTYLFPEPSDPRRVQLRWQPVLKHISRHQDSPLAATLSSPIYLFLAVTAYNDSTANPAELTQLPAATLERHLLDQLIPAVTYRHPRRDGRTYKADDVRRWLSTLANHLYTQPNDREGSPSDINLDQLWRAAGNPRLRYFAAAIYTLLVALPLLALTTWYIHATGYLLAPGLRGRFSVAACALFIAVVFVRASLAVKALHRLELSGLRSSRGRRRLLVWLTLGLTLGPAVGYASVLLSELFDGLTGATLVTSTAYVWLGLTLGVGLGLTAAVRSRPTAIKKPSQVIIQGLTYDGAVCIAFLALLGVVWIPFTSQLVGGLFSSLIRLALSLLAAAIFIADSPWTLYFIATRILAYRNKLPTRPARFLDWAYDAGLLRLSGIATQFRHRRFQDHLTTIQTNPTDSAIMSDHQRHPAAPFSPT
jgi:hypothetical protein